MKNLHEVPFGETIIRFLLMYLSPKHTAIFVIAYTIFTYFFILFGGIFSIVWFIDAIGFGNVFLLCIIIIAILFICWLIYIIMFEDTLKAIKDFEKKKREEE